MLHRHIILKVIELIPIPTKYVVKYILYGFKMTEITCVPFRTGKWDKLPSLIITVR